MALTKDGRGLLATARSLLVSSAKRLVGVVESFDDRSFLGHLLLVCALLPRGMEAEQLRPSDYLKFAKQKGLLVAKEKAQPGDVVIFPCPGACGDSADDGMAAGIVVRAHNEGMDVIAYVDAKVRRCHYGKTGPGPFRRCKIPSIRAVIASARLLEMSTN